jgi:hypothetical protein
LSPFSLPPSRHGRCSGGLMVKMPIGGATIR